MGVLKKPKTEKPGIKKQVCRIEGNPKRSNRNSRITFVIQRPRTKNPGTSLWDHGKLEMKKKTKMRNSETGLWDSEQKSEAYH